MYKKSIFIFITVFLLFAGQAQADDKITVKLKNTYSKIDSMEAEFSQMLLHKESGKIKNRTGILRFKKPLLVYWEIKDPAPEILLVGKDIIWNAFPDEEIAYKYSLELVQDSRSIIKVITGQSLLEQDFDYEEEGTEEGMSKIRLYPKQAVKNLNEAVLWIDKDSGLIKKVCIYDFFYNENEITFLNQKTNISYKDSVFSYTPDTNMLVEDRTDMEDGGELFQ